MDSGAKIWRPARRLARPVALLWLAALVTLRFEWPTYADRSANLDRVITGAQFDFAGWWFGAVWEKWRHSLQQIHAGMSEAEQRELVLRYLQTVAEYQQNESKVRAAYADPAIADPYAASAAARARRDVARAWLNRHQALVEGIIEQQVASVLREEGFAIGGEVYPPVRFRFSQLPNLLVLSRRDRIERLDSRELSPELPVDAQDCLERAIDRRFNVSSLITGIGGLGAYPTMLMESSALSWVVSTVAHEWTHNYLLAVLSPVGLQYAADPAMRVINETAAVIVEREVGPRVIERFYSQAEAALVADTQPNATAGFDFRAEMRATRLRVDELLAQGKIEEAEAYMEERRRLFVANG